MNERKKILKFFSLQRIIIPVIIGLGAAAYLFLRDFDRGEYQQISWSASSSFWLLCAFCLMAMRDLAYMYRIRLITDFKLSFKQSFQVIMLWEFASSITPSVVGGAAIALFIIRKEGINMGRTTAVVMITAMLDEMFYILVVPVTFIIAGAANLFPAAGDSLIFQNDMSLIRLFVMGYALIIFLTSIIIGGVFISPKGLKRILVRVFSLGILKRWKDNAEKTGDEIITTSREMRGKPFLFWLKAFSATFFSWTARYWVVNCLILAFTGELSRHFLVYARQLIMWVILLISPTPGSSGTAEYFFPLFLGPFCSGFESVITLSWRLISYYPYLFLGILVLPVWLRRVYLGNRRSIKFRS